MERPRLLVVDDDPCTRAALRTIFGREGWQVTLAATLAEALARLDPAPHGAILDLDLPDGPGESVLRELRARGLGTRVAVCSGIADPVRLAGVRLLAPELMLWKPIEVAPVRRLFSAPRSAGEDA